MSGDGNDQSDCDTDSASGRTGTGQEHSHCQSVGRGVRVGRTNKERRDKIMSGD